LLTVSRTRPENKRRRRWEKSNTTLVRVVGGKKKKRTNDDGGICTDVAWVEGRVNELKIQQDFL